MEQFGRLQLYSQSGASSTPGLPAVYSNQYDTPNVDIVDDLMVDSPIASASHRKPKPHAYESRAERARQTYAQRKTLKCRFCKQMHSCTFNLKQHERTHTREKPFSCEMCHRKFSRQWLLNRHMSTKHGINNKKKTGRNSGSSNDGDSNDENVEMLGPVFENDDAEWMPNDQFHREATSNSFVAGPTSAPADAVAPSITQPNLTASVFPTLDTVGGANSPDHQFHGEYPNNGIPGIDEADFTTWPVLTAQPPCDDEHIIVCAECGYTGNYASIAELQEHRHQAHIYPLQELGYHCHCQYCTQDAQAPMPLDTEVTMPTAESHTTTDDADTEYKVIFDAFIDPNLL